MSQEAEALSSAVEILESMDEAFYAIDRGWRFLYVNPGAERFWGMRRELTHIIIARLLR